MCKKCVWCGGKAVYLGFAGIGYYCPHCEVKLTEDEVINDMTVFARITASPEVLAEKLVYSITTRCSIGAVKNWYSTLELGTYFRTKEEAIAATVARLKEVENG